MKGNQDKERFYMLKNLLLLGILTWVTTTYAKTVVSHETMSDAESFKVEGATHEPEAKRSLAGSKIKKKKPEAHKEVPTESTDSDSEVRYWQYSE